MRQLNLTTWCDLPTLLAAEEEKAFRDALQALPRSDAPASGKGIADAAVDEDLGVMHHEAVFTKSVCRLADRFFAPMLRASEDRCAANLMEIDYIQKQLDALEKSATN